MQAVHPSHHRLALTNNKMTDVYELLNIHCCCPSDSECNRINILEDFFLEGNFEKMLLNHN